ncbi:hypothetical protein [Actinomadura sp. 21ATH]|uniref:hypothetical protein n=1 Tax=Actinomadura sp. 21ATH TaxID=1735444 RepID=UPI0035C0A68A
MNRAPSASHRSTRALDRVRALKGDSVSGRTGALVAYAFSSLAAAFSAEAER